jgi:hypothetical protein
VSFCSYFIVLVINCIMLPRAIKMNLANEGLEARKKEEEVTSRKRKAEEDKAWEGTLTVSLLSVLQYDIDPEGVSSLPQTPANSV